MVGVKVEILKVIDESFPLFVECVLVDCKGISHHFRDKLPIFSSDDSVKLPSIGVMGKIIK